MHSRSPAQRPQQHHALLPQVKLETSTRSSSPSAPVDDPGCLGNGSGLNVSATYLTASFGGAPAFYSLWLGQQCTSSVVVHLLFTIDSFRSMKVSSDRICFTPENYSEPQIVRIDVMDNRAHSNVISHRTYSLDKSYDRISTPCVIVKTEWCGVGSLFTFGGPMSKRKAAAVGSKITEVDIRKAMLTLPSASQAVAYSSGDAFSAAGDHSQRQDPPWFVCQLASGHHFSLAVVMKSQTSMLFAWGVNANGELGLGSTTSIAEPQLVTTLPMQVHGEQIDVITVSCGKHHAALVTTQAKLFTWGNNKYGQLGHGDYTNRLLPQEVHFALATLSSNQRALRIKHTILERGGTNVTQVACGAFHSLFVTHQQNILAMGYNQAGQLGIGHRLQQHKGWRSCVPIAVNGLRDRSVLDIAAGQNHSACVLNNGAVYVWGCGDDGRLGIGRTDCEMTPVLVLSLKECGIKARSVRCGARHTAVISDRDVLFMWGANEFGQLGCGDKKPRYKPCVLSPPVFIAEGAMDVALGEFHSVCVTHTGKAFVWGLDLIGESAQIDQRSSPKLVSLPESQRAQRVSCGWAHTNIATHSSQDAVVDSMSTNLPSSSSSTANLNGSPAQGTNFQRTIERKQLVLRKEELVRWKAYAGACGMPAYSGSDGGDDHENHAGWKSIKKPPSLVPASKVIPKCSNQGEDVARERLRVIGVFVKQTMDQARRNVAERLVFDKVTRLRSPSRAASAKREETPRRGIFYQNTLQPPELPPSSAIALRSLAASHHQHHASCFHHHQPVQLALAPGTSSAIAVIPPESALRPIRPQSSDSRCCRQSSGQITSCRPTAVSSPRAIWGLSREVGPPVVQPGETAAPRSSTGRAALASTSHQQFAGSRAPQVVGLQRETYHLVSPAMAFRSPRTPRTTLGAMETLMHRPTFSIAQAAIVPMRPRDAVQKQQQNCVRSPINLGIKSPQLQ